MRTDIEHTRHAFEEKAFAQRFLASIVKNSDPPKGTGALDFVSQNCPTQAEFIKRDKNGHYNDRTLDAMWWAWCEAINFQDNLALPSTTGAVVATDWDHRIITATSMALGGMIGREDDVERLMVQVATGESEDKLRTACEIAVALIRWAQDLKCKK